MKKRIIILGLCLVLLLIFISSSNGGIDPNYNDRFKAHPWSEGDLCPAQDPTEDDATSNNTITVFVVKTLGGYLLLIKGLDDTSSYKRSIHKTRLFQEK
jgi:hypothetical protein